MQRAFRFIKLPECSMRQSHFYPQALPIIMKYTKFRAAKPSLSLPPIFIMHGMLDTQKNWQPLAKQLAERSRRDIYTLDARNHGESPRNPEHGVEHLAADVKELMRVLHLHKIVGVGYDMGGNAMMTLALNRPDLIERAVIIDASPIAWPREYQVPVKLIDLLLSYVPKLPKQLPLARARRETVRTIIANAKTTMNPANIFMILQSIQRTPGGSFGLANNLQVIGEHWSEYVNYNNTIRHLAPYRAPILFITGERSHLIKEKDLAKIRHTFPNMSMKWLNSGHLVQMERPGECLDAILNFIK